MSFTNTTDTLIGSLAIALTILVPMMPGLEGLVVGDRVQGIVEASDGQYVILTLQKQ